MSHPTIPPHVVLYTRQGCHLCDDVAASLKGLGIVPQVVDVDDDPALQAQFDQCVPVVEINGKLRFRGKVNELLLRRQLAADSTQDAEPAP